jgi:hypothetical protein
MRRRACRKGELIVSLFVSLFAFVRVDVDDDDDDDDGDGDGDGNDCDAFIVGRDRDIGDDGKNIADDNADV